MIKKKMGKAEILKQNRFIHIKKEYLAKTCESLVVNKMKTPIFEQSTIYQIGGQARHSLEEHLFSIKSLIGLMEYLGEGVILNLVDIVSFFEREDILDVMETISSMNIKKKAYRLWYKLNEKTEIQVKTAVGMSEIAMVGALVGQGSAGESVASQAMVGIGLEEYFSGSKDEMYYGRIRVESAAFQDDICKPSSNTISAQISMTRLATMLQERGLDAHEEKTGYIIFGSSKYKKQVKQDLEEMPLFFGSFQVEEKIQDKYLGQILHQDGLAKSVEATIIERTGKIKGAIYLTKQVIETVQMQMVGGMMAAKQLWEQAIVPSLLHGASTWVGITSEAEEMCEDLQELFWRVMMQVPRSTPKVMLTAETHSMKMKQRIWKQKLVFASSLKQKEGSLASSIYEEQKFMGWPGLATEVEYICKQVGLESINESDIKKEEIDDKIYYQNYKEMKDKMERYDKLEDVKNDDFRTVQSYMEIKSIDRVRMAFRLRCKMVKEIKMNMKNMHKDLTCNKCNLRSPETQGHVMICSGWEEERRGLDLNHLEDMIEFFVRILKEKERK